MTIRRLPSSSPIRTATICDNRGMHVGILGGTGPAARRVAVRLGQGGVQVTLGSRQAERAESVAKEVVAAWPTLSLPIGGVDNEGGKRRHALIGRQDITPRKSPTNPGRSLTAQR